MYCPKCGIQNAETYKYCTACREDLRVVSQAMKRRFPVVLASKFDQLLDSRSERFRRDGVLFFLMGFVLLGAGLFGKLNTLWFSASPVFILFGVWSYLAYRRSLAPDFDWGTSNEAPGDAEPFDKSGIVRLGIVDSHAENKARTTNKKIS